MSLFSGKRYLYLQHCALLPSPVCANSHARTGECESVLNTHSLFSRRASTTSDCPVGSILTTLATVKFVMVDETMEQTASRSEIGTYLRDFADDFRLEGAARVDLDDDVLDINPSDDIMFEVTVEDEPESVGEAVRRLTFELTWEKTEYDEDLSG